MIATLVRRAVAAYRERLQRELPGRVLRVVLFGSWARGEAHEESDVDVFVLLTGNATWGERTRAIDLGAFAGIDHGLPFAPLVMTETEWDELRRRERLLPLEIERDGVPA